jgi:hypothetical protein
MEREYDLFEVLPDGAPMWLQSVPESAFQRGSLPRLFADHSDMRPQMIELWSEGQWHPQTADPVFQLVQSLDEVFIGPAGAGTGQLSFEESQFRVESVDPAALNPHKYPW